MNADMRAVKELHVEESWAVWRQKRTTFAAGAKGRDGHVEKESF
jgi:hypothetical protein